MPLYYALPLAFGLTGAIAITLVLIEVVPRVLEERERRKSREGRAVARKRREEPVQARGSARDENGWGYKIRQRKGKGKKDQRVEGQEDQASLRPIKIEREEEGARYVLSNPSDIELSSPDIERRPIKSSTFEPLHPIDETTTTTVTPHQDTSTTKSSSTQSYSESNPTNPLSPPLIPAPLLSEQTWCPTALNLIDISQSPLPASRSSTDPNPLEPSTTHSSSFSSPILLATSAFASPSLSHSTEPEWTFDSSPSSPKKKEKMLESESGSDAVWFRLSDDDDDDDEGGGDAEEIEGREVEEGAMREWEKVGREKGGIRALM